MKLIRYGGPMSRTRQQGDPIGYRKVVTEPHFWFQLENSNCIMPSWTPSSGHWQLSFNVFVQANGEPGGNANEFFLNSSATPASNGCFTQETNTQALFAFTTTVPTTIQLTTSNMTKGVPHFFEAQCRPGDSYLRVDGVMSTNNVVIPVAPTYARIWGGASTSCAVGSMWGLTLTDINNPANSRWYPMNEGSGNEFLCYLEDKVTRYPAGDVTITAATDDHWSMTPYVQPPTVVMADTTGEQHTPIQQALTVTRKTYPVSGYAWGIAAASPTQGGTFSDTTAEDPSFTPTNVGTYNLRAQVFAAPGPTSVALNTTTSTAPAAVTTYVFNGVDSKAVAATGWAVPATPWTISGKFSFAVGTTFTATRYFISQGSAASPAILISSAGRCSGRIASNAATVFVNSPQSVSAEAQYLYEFSMVATPSGTQMILNGDSGTVGAIADAVQGGVISQIATYNSVFQPVTVAHLYCHDETDPANSVYWPMTEGSGLTFLAYQDPTMAVRKPTYDMTITPGTGGAGTGWQPFTGTYPPAVTHELPE